ncbi:MAG: beta-ketoacyl-[acyl-carrier-protein] synthase family protein, partial [Oligoflexales bacterium]|nr:beta-ketoacyl-[acyl-carrier-protein] synthase family protein [Oligoflexales bacterium]
TSYLKTNDFSSAANSTTFLKIMPHTSAANLAITFSIPGPIYATCSACAASTQAIGQGYEAISSGRLERVIAGGAEELHIGVAAVFDVLGATSTRFNGDPSGTPRPFDAKRDGIVVGEGAGTLILEDYELARGRGCKIYGEIAGYYTNNSSSHMTSPSIDGLYYCAKGALDNAGIAPSDIYYVNAHATGTQLGDSAESHAIARLFGRNIKVSSTKGHLGHLMGAAGVLETIASIGMLEQGMILPTRNLESPGAECGDIDYVMKNEPASALEYVLKNSFAFGGINASLVLRRGDVDERSK